MCYAVFLLLFLSTSTLWSMFGESEVALSPNEKYIVSSYHKGLMKSEGKLTTWRKGLLSKYLVSVKCNMHKKHINRIVFSNDGSLLCSVSADGTAKIFDSSALPNLWPIDTLEHEDAHTTSFNQDQDNSYGDLRTISFSQDNSCCITANLSSVKFFRKNENNFKALGYLTKKGIAKTFSYNNGSSACCLLCDDIALTQDKQTIIAEAYCHSSQHPNIACFDIQTGKEITQIHNTSTVLCFAKSSDDSNIILGSNHGELKIYDLKNNKVIHAEKMPAQITRIVIHPDNSQVAVLSEGKVFFKDLLTHKILATAEVQNEAITSIGLGKSIFVIGTTNNHLHTCKKYKDNYTLETLEDIQNIEPVDVYDNQSVIHVKDDAV